MPFALLIIGIWLLIAGVRDTAGPVTKQNTLFYLVRGDFTGPDNFVYWFIAILLIGSIGYISKLKPLSTAFLWLVIVVLFLKKGSSSGVGGGFFNQFIAGIGITQQAGPDTVAAIQKDLSANKDLENQIMKQQQDLSNTIDQQIQNNIDDMQKTIDNATTNNE